MILHGFFRSTASWRVRIALALKGLEYDQHSYKLRAAEQRSDAYLAKNPQGLVPSLELDDGVWLNQSLAIVEYLDEIYPSPALLPQAAAERAKVRAASMVIACDIHPVQNLKVLGRVRKLAGEDAVEPWARETIEEGLDAFSRLLPDDAWPYCFGEQLTLADLCLVPQLANARRFGAKWDYGRIAEVERACMAHPAFADTRPELQHDAG